MIRQSDASEAHALAALQQSSIVAECSNAYSGEQITAWIAVLQPEAYSTLINHAEVLVATDDPGTKRLGVGVCSPETGQINAVYVAPGMTRRGIGRALTNAIEALLLDASALEARLDATLNAVAFYCSLGYGNEVPAMNRLPSGIDLPCVAMSKRLD
jgi:ribosomal protein S18 acetylase RimI-like enzyme